MEPFFKEIVKMNLHEKRLKALKVMVFSFEAILKIDSNLPKLAKSKSIASHLMFKIYQSRLLISEGEEK